MCNWCRTAGVALQDGNVEGARKLHGYCAGNCTCQHWIIGDDTTDN